MEAFFDREVQRLDFTTQRMDVRALEKKALDTAKVEAGDKVALLVHALNHNCNYRQLSFFLCRKTRKKQ